MATTEIEVQKVFGFVMPSGSDGVLIRQSVIATFTAVFLTVVFALFVFPRTADLQKAEKRMKDLEAESKMLMGTLEALDQFKQNVTDNDRESVHLAIPKKFDPGYILLSLRKLAAENGVNLANYKLSGGEISGEEEKADTLVSHQVELSISGAPVDLIDFVETLDHYLPVATASDLSLSEVSRVLGSGLTDSRLSVKLTYYHMPSITVTAESFADNLLTQKDLDTIAYLSTYTRLGGFVGNVQLSGGRKEDLFGL